ncbi:MAG: RluA family pseudouridine synthase [Treponemataceae bacterium]
MPQIKVTIDDEEFVPQRLDKYISSIPNGITRSRLKTGIKSIMVNGRPAKLSKMLNQNDEIFLEWDDPIPEHIEGENIPLEILFEDDNVCVINKRQGMVTHPASGNWTGTLVNALLFHWKKESVLNDESQVFRSGIVHRLDKDTSGVMITAKNRDAEGYLQNQFKIRRVKKEYIAIVVGRPPEKRGSIKTQILRSPHNRKIFIATDNKNKGKFAHTVYSWIASFGNYSVMRLKLKTGRTHQIRVHLKHLGCPILGDPIYGKKDHTFAEATLMLHSRRLGIFFENETQQRIFDAPIPPHMKNILRELKSLYERD